GVDQVDVGGEVQFPAAELAQAEHDQPLRSAGRIAYHAVALRELLLQRLQRQRQALLGQLRAAGQGGVDVVQAKHVAPYQAGGRGGAEAAELPGPVVWLQRVQHRWRQRRRIVRGQVLQQRRLAAQ